MTFGATGKAGWLWEDGGVHELAGKVEVRLRDQTGYYGRCDVVVLTDDLAWTPPADVKTIAALREKHGGVSRNVELMPRPTSSWLVAVWPAVRLPWRPHAMAATPY